MQVSTASRDLEMDDICFGQTACIKLAKLLQGTLSVGLPSLQTGFPDPRSFFHESFHVMGAYATVLHTIGGKASATELILDLRRHSADIQNELQRLHAAIVAASKGAGPETSASFRTGSEAASRICDLAGAYARLLGKDLPLFSEVKVLALRLFERMAEMCQTPQP